MEGELELRSILFGEEIITIPKKKKENNNIENNAENIMPTLVPLNGSSNYIKNYVSKPKMSKLIKIYKEFPKPILEQLDYLDRKFPTHPQIERKARHLARQENIDLKIAKFLAIYEFFDTRDFFHRRFFDGIFCSEPDGRRVYLNKKLTKKKIERVCLFKGTLINKKDNAKPLPVIVKWYESDRKDTEYEISMYCELRQLNCKIPWFSSSYMLWKTPVLVMEPLEEITGEDDEFEAAAQVIQELKIIHQKGIHNDIKRQNVMKRKYKPNSKRGVDKGEWEYLVIDYGGMTTEKLGHGWKRSVWSPKYTCQKPHPKKPQITTQWHDFKETGIMIKDIQTLRVPKKKKTKSIKDDVDELRDPQFWDGRLKIFMDYLHSEIDKKNVQMEDYDNLIAICRTGKPLKDSSQKRKLVSPPLKYVPQETLYAVSQG
jgi:hypothetical protein